MRRLVPLLVLTTVVVFPAFVRTDGKVVRHRTYQGPLEEFSQEAIIIFHDSDKEGEAVEDLILKIGVKGQTDKFGWVVPFPKEPKVEKARDWLFEELQRYVWKQTTRQRGRTKSKSKSDGGGGNGAAPVEVVSREVVGSYDVAIVREKQAGALNAWLDKEGYQKLPDDAHDVLEFYRQKGYVFACLKVAAAELAKKGTADLHPLRFTFRTGGRDGIYFPMKMTGLQSDPFDVNLYVFSRWWVDNRGSRYGFKKRGFFLKYREKDTTHGGPNDPVAWDLPATTTLLKTLHPGDSWYFTNLRATGLRPAEVRKWKDDLWLFPLYTRRNEVPADARPGGVAAGWFEPAKK